MIAERVPRSGESTDRVCAFASRWTIDQELAFAITRMQARFPYELKIFSGFRSSTTQRDLIDQGTGAPDDLSTHRSCPATGADLDVIGVAHTDVLKAMFGEAAVIAGMRWGGGAPTKNGIPVGVEWHHVDLGPRKRP